eukprot:m.204556 g.204556  ORF g.204556 m.204556 type:complete len:284 (+) comp32891_c1_seq1:362-1213(+)
MLQALVFLMFLMLTSTAILCAANVAPHEANPDKHDSTLAHCKIISTSRNKKSLRFELVTTEHKFEIKMASIQPKLTSSSPKHTAWSDGETVEIDITHHHWMSGVVVNHTDSSVRMHVDTTTRSPCDSLTGMIRVGTDMFVVEPTDSDGATPQLRLQHESIAMANNGPQSFPPPSCDSQSSLAAEQANLSPWNASTNTNNTNTNTNNSNDDAQSIVVFSERKTKAYNDLIRMCDACGTKENVFEVLDAMEANRIQMDMGTMLALEEIFTLGVKRAPSPAERGRR